MMKSLTAEKLACMRGERLLFDDVSFRVSAGQALAVEGANGAGKTSLLRLLAGFLTPHAGRLLVHTDSGQGEDPEQRQRLVGWLGHLDGLKPQMTVLEQLRFYAGLYKVHTVDFAQLLAQVGLARQSELFCRYLSAGQRRRLALARLQVSQRPLWLLDEPFAALDTAGQALVAHMMARHCSEGGIVIAATHDPLGLGNESLRL